MDVVMHGVKPMREVWRRGRGGILYNLDDGKRAFRPIDVVMHGVKPMGGGLAGGGALQAPSI